MKKIIIVNIGLILILCACGPKISTSIIKNYSPLDYREEVRLIGLKDSVPKNSEIIGYVKMGDTGFSTICGWDLVIEKAKLEARKAGGNAIKILEHKPPSAMGSSCHRITAQIMKVNNFDSISKSTVVDSTLLNADYALLHIYRNSGMGAFVSYDLYIGDSVICRVSNRWKTTIKIRKDGLNTLWAKTEAKDELPINIKFGNEYYIRCSVTMGAMVGHPKIEIVDNENGKEEFNLLKLSKAKIMDKLILNDGREIECQIISEDDEFVYFSTSHGDEFIKAQIYKNQIKTILRGE